MHIDDSQNDYEPDFSMVTDLFASCSPHFCNEKVAKISSFSSIIELNCTQFVLLKTQNILD